MRNNDEQAREYDRMRGSYLGLVASLEMNLTFLLAEWLEVGRHREEFHGGTDTVPFEDTAVRGSD